MNPGRQAGQRLKGPWTAGAGIARRGWAIAGVRYVLVLAIGLAAYAAVLLLAGKDPIQAYRDTFSFTLGSWYGFSEVVVRMIPLLLTAIAVALPSKLGLINVGGEGQLYMGAWLATWGAITFPTLPATAFIPLLIGLGFVGGGVWAAVAGFFRARGLVNETITTLLMNYVSPLIVGFFVYGAWRSREIGASAFPQSAAFPAAARLPRFFNSRIHLGLVLALVLLFLFWFVVEKTAWGLKMRAIGGNPEAARRLGIRLGLYIVVAMFVAGGIAGLAGMAEVSALHGRLRAGFSPGYGFSGFLISWLAGGSPLGIVTMSFVLAVVFSAGSLLQITQGVPFAAINVLMALILFVVLAKPRLLGRLS
ncbi:MAG: Nucleoside ABC transporter, permease protein 1 [Candidatus Bipolaricaulis sibiricus]|uniref:Nucleoside ABC transporter, permease protein 1 n=1 Tax=Bipolaricaulis sibiricus TaxID=2501609 RepID=A0A410FTY7_BIPS1|nr:MAG: Nucleoside ABC transporter, permease protein 1 [Candidatus Bipolaricaulis sibiricus]